MAALCLNCFRIPTDVFILSDAVFPGEAPFSAYICRPECLHRSAELYFLPFVFGVDGLLFAVDGSFIERGRCPVEYVVGTFRRSGNLSGGTDGLGLAAGKAYRQGGPSSMDGPPCLWCMLPLFQSGMGGSQPCDGHPERRAGYVVEAREVAELHGSGVAAVFAADAALELRFHIAALEVVDCHGSVLHV